MPKGRHIHISSLYIGLYILASALVFFFFAEPYLSGSSDIRWGADSMDYISYYQNAGLDQSLIKLGQNLFGPLAILWLCDGNSYSVFVLNLVVYLLAWFLIVLNLPVDRRTLFFALSANPMLFISLLAVNKEIISFLAVALYATYLGKRSLSYLMATLAVAVFVRWQHVLIIVLFEVARTSISPTSSKRVIAMILLVFGLTIIYPSLDAQLGGVTTEEVDAQQADTTFGLLEVANNVQRNYGYFLVAVPKLLSNWFGNLPRAASVYLQLGDFDHKDIYNTYAITGHQLAMLGIVIYLLWRRRFSLENDLTFFCVFYSVVYSLGIFIQYRYYFPVYLMLCIVLAQKGLRNTAWRT